MERSVLVLLSLFALSGCGTTNSYLTTRNSTTEYYRVFDLRTKAPPALMAQAASDGLARNVNDMQTAIPLQTSAEVPAIPGRFKLVSPLQGSALAALAGSAGNVGLRVATCDGAVWTATANRVIQRSNQVRITACLYRYQLGYNLNLYAVVSQQEGGLMQLSRSMAYAMVGTPEEWTDKTLFDVVRELRKASGAEVTLLEAQPAIAGLPWLDALESR